MMPRARAAFTALLVLAVAPVCAPAREGEATREVLLWLNYERAAASLPALTLHPLLSELAADRATDLAEQGSLDSSTGDLSRLSRRMLSRGYDAHVWSESSLAGGGGIDGLLEAWQRDRPQSWSETALGQYEDVGVGVSTLDGEPLVVLLFAVPERSEFFRRAAPLEDLGEVRAELLAATNAQRREHGREPLVSRVELDAAAQAYARRMLEEGFYDHVAPDGGRLGERLAAEGYRARIGAENLAKGLFEPAEVIDRWMASRGHRKNLLNRAFTEVGHGVAAGEGPDGTAVLWVQVFGVR